MLDNSGIFSPPNDSDTLGFSTSTVVTINPPAPLLHTDIRECPCTVSLMSVWKVPPVTLIRPPQVAGIWFA